MATQNLADLFDEYNELKGTISFRPNYKRISDKHVDEIIFCNKKVGNSQFSLKRNPEFELIFTYQTGELIHQSRLDLNTFQPVFDTNLLLNWGPDYCEIRWDFNSNCCEMSY